MTEEIKVEYVYTQLFIKEGPDLPPELEAAFQRILAASVDRIQSEIGDMALYGTSIRQGQTRVPLSNFYQSNFYQSGFYGRLYP